MENCWVQPEGQPAELLRLLSGSTLQGLLTALDSHQRVEFQLPDRTYALFPTNTPLADLQQECSQDGRTEATALQIHVDQAQGSSTGRGQEDSEFEALFLTVQQLQLQHDHHQER